MKKLNFKGCIICASTILVFLILFTFAKHSMANANSKLSNTHSNDFSKINRDTFLSVDSEGILQISRNNRKEDISMGKDNTWTIFMYITGTNLESNYGYATNDIEEMFHSKINNANIDKVNIIIQTGGASKWNNKYIRNDKLQRFKIDLKNNQLTLLEEYNNSSMGDANNLYHFLNWGVSNYPAEHMGVIFWDHGTGVSSGICNDENYNNDSITVHELEYTFAKLSKQMTSKFEVIGFDTCLAGSLEYTNILAPYTKYMIASADIIPGDGWHYTTPIEFLFNNPDATGKEFGKVVCDTYANFYDNMSTNDSGNINYTISTYDLHNVDAACVETNYLTKYLYEHVINSEKAYWDLSGFRSSRLRYGMDNVDIGSILEYLDNSKDYTYNTYFYRKALDNLIVYSRISQKYQKRQALGLTLYLPSSIITMRELNTYRNICFSPYWLKYIEWTNIKAVASNMEHFIDCHWENSPYFFEENFNFLNYDQQITSEIGDNTVTYKLLSSNQYYSDNGFPFIWYNNITSAPPKTNTFNIADIKIKHKPNKSLNVLPSFKLENTYNKISAIYNNIYIKENDMLVCLGQNDQITYDPSTNIFSSSYDNKWFVLPDGQPLTTYIISKENNTTTYAFPVMINNEESSIRIETYINDSNTLSYNILGVWDSTNSKYTTDKFTRGYLPLNIGTTITPIYDIYNPSTKTYHSKYGNPYTISNNFCFLVDNLNTNNKFISYEIKNVDNESIYTDLTPLE